MLNLRTRPSGSATSHASAWQSRFRSSQLKLLFWLLAILLGSLQVAANLYTLWSDAVSYLDIGDAYFQGDFQAALNACWSPLYSWIVGLVLFVTRPAPAWEILVIKMTNLLIYMAAIVCFEFFLARLIQLHHSQLHPLVDQAQPEAGLPSAEPADSYWAIPDWVWITAGYSLFIWSALKWIGVARESPDMLVAAIVYLAAGLLLQIQLASGLWSIFGGLGAVLGLGYLAKSSMFPLAFVFLLASALAHRSVSQSLRRTLPKVLLALLVFSLIAAPWITALSWQKGRLTFGDAGALNYAWYVSPRAPDTHWQGLPAGSGVPQHPTRKIGDHPATYEFATPIRGTFAPWYDPSYWNEGLKPHFKVSQEIRMALKNLLFCYPLFLGSLIFNGSILLCLGGRSALSRRPLSQAAVILLPAVAGLGGFLVMTELTSVQTRYLAPFIVLLLAGIFAPLRLPNSPESKRVLLGLLLIALLVSGSRLGYGGVKDLTQALRLPPHLHWQIASELQKLQGRSPHTVAVLGEWDYYWARLAQVKIVASIPRVQQFWAVDAPTRAQALATLAQTGASIVVQQPGLLPLSPEQLAEGWQEIGRTRTYLYRLRP